MVPSVFGIHPRKVLEMDLDLCLLPRRNRTHLGTIGSNISCMAQQCRLSLSHRHQNPPSTAKLLQFSYQWHRRVRSSTFPKNLETSLYWDVLQEPKHDVWSRQSPAAKVNEKLIVRKTRKIKHANYIQNVWKILQNVTRTYPSWSSETTIGCLFCPTFLCELHRWIRRLNNYTNGVHPQVLEAVWRIHYGPAQVRIYPVG
jgi:hypothetical protein